MRAVLVPNLDAGRVRAFFEKLKASGRDEAFFYRWDDEERGDVGAYTAWAFDERTPKWIVLEGGSPVALFELEKLKGKSCRAHYAILPFGPKKTITLYRFMAATALYIPMEDGSGYMLDRIVGITPSTNKASVKIIKHGGGRIVREKRNTVCIFERENVPQEWGKGE